jgi:hypothetical protein
MSPYTIQGKVRALKALSSWFFKEGYIGKNFLSDLRLPKVTLNDIIAAATRLEGNVTYLKVSIT